MKTVCLYFQVHQPFRLRKYRFLDIGKNHAYFDDSTNASIMQSVSQNCYLKTNELLLKTIKSQKGQFRIAFSISGTALDQFEEYAPRVLDSFQELAKTGHVEFIAETYAHSMASLKSESEFKRQVNMHIHKIHSLFGQTPLTFRNTELIISDEICQYASDLGFQAILAEGASQILNINSPNHIYKSATVPELKILTLNYKLSDDLAFRFSDKKWKHFPLTPRKYTKWIKDVGEDDSVFNLFMHYETFGEHQKEASGIFEFLTAWPKLAIKNGLTFSTPSDIFKNACPKDSLQIPSPCSWADEERDLSAWLGNDMQKEAFNKLYDLQFLLLNNANPELQKKWLYLQTSDHFYYMSTEFFSDGDVHKYFNPYESPFLAFANFMNVISDFEAQLKQSQNIKDEKDVKIAQLEARLAQNKN